MDLKNIEASCAIIGWNNNMKLYETPRKPRPLAPRMNWQNKYKNNLTKTKYDSILSVGYYHLRRVNVQNAIKSITKFRQKTI